MPDKKMLKAYWKENVRYLVILLFIWFLVSYGCGILFVDELTSLRADLTWTGRSACSIIVLTLYRDTPCLQHRKKQTNRIKPADYKQVQNTPIWYT